MSEQQISPNPNIEYERLFNQLNDACVIFTLQNNTPIIIKANDTFKETFCHDTDTSLTSKSLNELIVPKGKEKEAEQLDKRTTQNIVNEEIIERRTKTGIRTFMYRGIPLNKNRGFGIYMDITERMRQKQCIDVLQRVIRHNFRNELGVILGNTNAILDSDDAETMKKHAKIVNKAGERLDSLIGEADVIRDIIDSHGDIETHQIQLKPVLEEAIITAEENHNEPTIALDCEDSLTINANGKIQHVFEALIDNGIRHNDINDPEVIIQCQEVNDTHVEIEISDNGPGIPSGDKKIITDDCTMSPLEHGSGLGLWVARWVTEISNGTISVKTRPDVVGTTFIITLPKTDSEVALKGM